MSIPVRNASKQHIKDVESVSFTLGGDEKMAALCQQKQDRAVWRWRKENRIPSCYYVAVTTALAAKGHTVDPLLFGQKIPAYAQEKLTDGGVQ